MLGHFAMVKSLIVKDRWLDFLWLKMVIAWDFCVVNVTCHLLAQEVSELFRHTNMISFICWGAASGIQYYTIDNVIP